MYLQLHSVKDSSKNHDTWVRVLTGYLQGRVRFGFLHTFTSGFGFGSALGKTWVLVRFVLAGFGFFPISAVDFPT